jgi:hypothetical protein
MVPVRIASPDEEKNKVLLCQRDRTIPTGERSQEDAFWKKDSNMCQSPGEAVT